MAPYIQIHYTYSIYIWYHSFLWAAQYEILIHRSMYFSLYHSLLN